MDNHRTIARQLAQTSIAAGNPLDWFEQLYAKARLDGVSIPWADHTPNPNMIELFQQVDGQISFGRRALKVGCGLGDDAEWLSDLGFEVTAFDISPTAISECGNRFPNSKVTYVICDLFQSPENWLGAFDLVLESYTLQVLPPELRAKALKQISGFVSFGGYLMLIARLREELESTGLMPWPLVRREIEILTSQGFVERYAEDYFDGEQPPVRRFRGCYQRKA
ncbi:class I SAM-dependent methyltransferase [Methylomonas sp. MK1]|uniref:class I SAM-dependent methyltransferase n=1 Tax=Methylomonas sp. MK1 TaxID=1131552 RepID=UPI00037389D8|nr:methyltransferase domain-containing protein [Methylomonas sp. MK1]